MSKTLVIKVGKRGRLQLPPEIAEELPEGTELAVKHDANGCVTLLPVKTTQISREEAVAGIQRMMDELSRMADEKGITEEDILAAIKRVRARKYGTARRS